MYMHTQLQVGYNIATPHTNSRIKHRLGQWFLNLGCQFSSQRVIPAGISCQIWISTCMSMTINQQWWPVDWVFGTLLSKLQGWNALWGALSLSWGMFTFFHALRISYKIWFGHSDHTAGSYLNWMSWWWFLNSDVHWLSIVHTDNVGGYNSLYM